MAIACTVLGSGSWGTALATQLARRGHDVVLWGHDPVVAASINDAHVNPRYVKGETLPDNLRASTDLGGAVAHAKLLVPCVPSHALRDVMAACARQIPLDAVLCTATKGIENGSLDTMDQVLRETLPAPLHAASTILSGPSFALEVVRGLPTAVAIAGEDEPAHFAADAFHGDAFRAYTTHDVMGVCIGGSLKNVMAIACGISDGIGLGLNARAAIITRGLAEVTRLAVAMGADPLTMMGLAGVGDLVLTCTGSLSRNYRVGIALGQGKKLAQILDELGEVAEGVKTAESGSELGAKVGVELPITEQVYEVIHRDKPAALAMMQLLSRARKSERG